MVVLGVNNILKWCQVINGTGTYTCQTKEINGELFFKFKRVWYPVAEYISENAMEMVEEGGKTFLRPFKK